MGWDQECTQPAKVQRAALRRLPECWHGHAELAAAEEDWVHDPGGEGEAMRTKVVENLVFACMHEIARDRVFYRPLPPDTSVYFYLYKYIYII